MKASVFDMFVNDEYIPFWLQRDLVYVPEVYCVDMNWDLLNNDEVVWY